MKHKGIYLLTGMVLLLGIPFQLPVCYGQPAHSVAPPSLSPTPKNPSAALKGVSVPPPKVRVYLEGAPIYEGREIALDVEVTWPVESAGYAVRPPEFDLPKGLEQVSASSVSNSERQGLLAYRFGIMVQKAGAYKISPLKVSYLAAGAKQEAALEVEGVSFEAVPYTWLGLKIKDWWLIGGGAAAILTLSGWLVVVYRRRRQAQANLASQKAQILQVISLCKSHKADGRHVKFFETIEELYKTLGLEDTGGSIWPVIDKIRFGGYNPTPEEVNKAYCELGNKIKEIFPDQEGAWE